MQVIGESQLPNIWWTETRFKRLMEPCIFCNVWLKVAIYLPSICFLTPVSHKVHDMITVHSVLQRLLTIYEVVLCCHHQVGTGKLGRSLQAWTSAQNEFWGAKIASLSVVCM